MCTGMANDYKYFVNNDINCTAAVVTYALCTELAIPQLNVKCAHLNYQATYTQ